MLSVVNISFLGNDVLCAPVIVLVFLNSWVWILHDNPQKQSPRLFRLKCDPRLFSADSPLANHCCFVLIGIVLYPYFVHSEETTTMLLVNSRNSLSSIFWKSLDLRDLNVLKLQSNTSIRRNLAGCFLLQVMHLRYPLLVNFSVLIDKPSSTFDSWRLFTDYTWVWLNPWHHLQYGKRVLSQRFNIDNHNKDCKMSSSFITSTSNMKRKGGIPVLAVICWPNSFYFSFDF